IRVDTRGDGRRRTPAGRGPPDGRAHRRRDRLAGSAHGAARVVAQRACPAHAVKADELRAEASFLDLTLWALRRFPDRIAIVEDDRQLTYRDVSDRLSQLAGALGDRGFARGNGLMVLAGNRADALLVGLAVRMLGAWSGALHPLGSADDQ